ncbi:MAG: ATP-dependent DNA helicase [Bacilli bacterium]|nr:ATP-dependent DNA helicase [Bacilli bacterium]
MYITKSLSLSVHDLVDFLLRTGDIDNRIYNQDTMSRGSLIHATYQKKRVGDYYPEYYLKTTLKVEGFTVTLDGRADGIYLKDIPVIEELKSTIEDLDIYFKKNEAWHLGQAICYAYMFLKERRKEKAIIELVYISQVDEKRKKHQYEFTYQELEAKVIQYIHDYLNFYHIIYEHKLARSESAEALKFPFKSYRKGQKAFINLSEEIAQNGGVAFIEAPTGIGKTMSALYPLAKSFATTDNDKIFYLTAKNTGKEAAYLASSLLVNNGLDVGAIYITAKEKICAKPGASCNPDECPFARDYYTHLKDALIYAIKNQKLYHTEMVKKVADKFRLCPFEFSLDLSLYMDIVIADYNYFFDPIVHLERYFDNDAHRYLVLVDEAHNLLDRASEMYSESISYALFKAFKADYRYANNKLKRAMSRVKKVFESLLLVHELGDSLIEDIDHETFLAFTNLYTNINEYLKDNAFHPNETSIDFSRRLNRFLKLYDLRQDSDALFISKSSNDDLSINLLCLDPSSRIRTSLDLVKGSVLFSATLTPLDYYQEVLGGKKEDHSLVLPSPFPKENFKLIIAPAGLKYKERDASLEKVLSYLDAFTSSKKGNYLIFAPSFEYLDKITPHFMNKENQEVYIQSRSMDEKEKLAFLEQFKTKKSRSVIGLTVVGGAFAEGIDLVADSLIGVAVIGVGLPTISFRRNLIKDYYDQKELHGFSYAYKHPGMNKVSQAVGRLIRSEEDVGAALLIDDRYLTHEYRKLFKAEWQEYEVVTTPAEIKEILKAFNKGVK